MASDRYEKLEADFLGALNAGEDRATLVRLCRALADGSAEWSGLAWKHLFAVRRAGGLDAERNADNKAERVEVLSEVWRDLAAAYAGSWEPEPPVSRTGSPAGVRKDTGSLGPGRAGIVAFIASLAWRVPQVRPLLEEHLADNDGQVLAHLRMWDYERWAEAAFARDAPEPTKLLTALEDGYASGDDSVQELIRSRFWSTCPNQTNPPEDSAAASGPTWQDSSRTLSDLGEDRVCSSSPRRCPSHVR